MQKTLFVSCLFQKSLQQPVETCDRDGAEVSSNQCRDSDLAALGVGLIVIGILLDWLAMCGAMLLEHLGDVLHLAGVLHAIHLVRNLVNSEACGYPVPGYC